MSSLRNWLGKKPSVQHLRTPKEISPTEAQQIRDEINRAIQEAHINRSNGKGKNPMYILRAVLQNHGLSLDDLAGLPSPPRGETKSPTAVRVVHSHIP